MAGRKSLSKEDLDQIISALDIIIKGFDTIVQATEEGLGTSKPITKHMYATQRKFNKILTEFEAEKVRCE